MKLLGFSVAVAAGLTTLSLAFGSVPSHTRVTDDTAIYQNLSEIRVPKTGTLNFDSDIDQLAALEGRYHERLPSLADRPSIRTPMRRVSQKQYRYSGSSSRSAQNR